MKIIFSPTKSQGSNPLRYAHRESNCLFPEKTQTLIDRMSSFSLSDLKQILNISESIAGKTYIDYQNLKQGIAEDDLTHAIGLFSGTSFRELNLELYSETSLDYLQDHLCILSALYGVLRPFDLVAPYRLDMENKIFEERNLYEFWQNVIDEYFKDQEIILNLASGEYSKMLKNYQGKIINVHFLVIKDGKEKSVSVYVKQQRGKMLNYLIINKTIIIDDLKQYESDGFVFDRERSNENNLFFIKTVSP